MHRMRTAVIILATLAATTSPLLWSGVASAGPPSWHLTKVIGPSAIGEMTGVSCKSTTHCVATNYGGYIYSTTNGWATYHRVRGFGTHPANNMNAVTCISTTTCIAVGGWGTSTTGYGIIDRTTNAGATWVSEHPGTTWPLWAVTCPTATVCYAVGDRNGHTAYWMKSTNAGVTWTAHVGIDPSIGVLDSVSCNSAIFCAVTGSIATSANTSNGGVNWSDGTLASNVRYLFGISCQLSSECEAVGSTFKGAGLALRSTDGGLGWTQMTVPGGVSNVASVDCVTSNYCYAVGRTGTTNQNGHGVALVSFDDATFTTMALPAGSSALLSVSCLTTNHCTAVGTNSSGAETIFTYY
jgi:hypothetical protein